MLYDIKTETIQEHQKSQLIRLVDVFLIAPLLIHAGTTKSNLTEEIKFSLVGIGIATFIYNGRNYLKN
jgi:hypothetical protein